MFITENVHNRDCSTENENIKLQNISSLLVWLLVLRKSFAPIRATSIWTTMVLTMQIIAVRVRRKVRKRVRAGSLWLFIVFSLVLCPGNVIRRFFRLWTFYFILLSVINILGYDFLGYNKKPNLLNHVKLIILVWDISFRYFLILFLLLSFHYCT